MIFKDRGDAGEKLSEELLKDKNLLKERKSIIVVSLLRGGVVVGKTIAGKLHVQNILLAATKIGSPLNPELAIGAVCLNKVHLDKEIIKQLGIKKETVDLQVGLAKFKHYRYIKKFGLEKINYRKKLNKKTAIIVDDGIATGSTVKAAFLFIKSMKPEKIILAVPVAPTDLALSVVEGFDKIIILHKEPDFNSVSQFYESFPQVEFI